MALAIAPKFVFDIHKTLLHIVIAILPNEETESPMSLAHEFCPRIHTGPFQTALSPKSSLVLSVGSRKAFQHPDSGFTYNLETELLNHF